MSDLPASVSDAERHAWHYWFVDGLPHLLSGAGCLSVAAAILLKDILSGLPFVGFAVVAYGCAVIIILRMRKILDWLKARMTYPRTGYVTPPYFAYFAHEQRVPTALTILAIGKVAEQRASEDERIRQDLRHQRVAVSVIITVGAVLATLVAANRWICLAAGLATSVLLWVVTRKDDRLSGVVLLGLPIVAFFYAVSSMVRNERTGFFLAGIGLWGLLEGGLRLVRYLRHHPRVQPS